MKTTHSPKQIEHALSWIANWYNNEQTQKQLRCKGIQAIDIWNRYAVTTNFPMGHRSFFPLIHSYVYEHGGTIEKLHKEVGNVYVIVD